MRRILTIIKTELLMIKSTLPFHIIAILSPITFLFIFAGNLTEDITFPATFDTNSAFTTFLTEYSAPSGFPYLKTDPTMDDITIKEIVPVAMKDGVLSGEVNLTIGSINKNITKNYRNRLTGAINAYFGKMFPTQAITVREHPRYRSDPKWTSFFTASIFIFGILLSGILFGALSFTGEWVSGTILLLKLSPRPPVYLLSGKMIGALIKGTVCIIIYGILSIAINGEFIFSSALLIPVILITYLMAIALGMIIGLKFRQAIVAFIIALVGSLVLWISGGGFGTTSAMSHTLSVIAEYNPVTSLIRVIHHCCFAGPLYGFDLIYPSVITVVLIVLLFVVYYKNFYMPAKPNKNLRRGETQ